MNGEFIYQEAEGASAGEPTGIRERCPECESETLVADDVHGEMVCGDCGCVLGTGQIDTGPEWSAYTHAEGEQKSRVGAPLTGTMHDRGLTTKIHWKDADAQGQTLSDRKRTQLRRLRTWQERIRTKDAGERNLQLALAEINRMSSVLGVPKPVRETASMVYRQALDRDLVQGRSIEGVATAALYTACRQEEIPRSLDEVADIARVGRVEIGRTYRYLASELNLEMRPVDPRRYLPRFCSELGIDESIQQRATEVLDEAAEAGLLSGKSPTGLAGAAIYVASLEAEIELTQNDIASVAQVTEVTIRNRYQEQVELLDGGTV